VGARPGGAPRLIWLYGIREAAADRNAPLVGAIVDITRIAHSLKFAASHGAAATADPTRIGRFSWDQSTGVIQVSPDAADIVGLDGGGTVSIGVATGSRDADPEDLLRVAGLAMHKAKANGRNRVEFVDPRLSSEATRRLLVDGAVRDALRDGELAPWFQPIVRLADSGVVGYEALVRWVRPDGSIVEPAAFLPVAERTSLITEIDRTILELSVATLSRLRDPLFVAVNVSAAALAQPDYADRVLELLEGAHGRPSRRTSRSPRRRCCGSPLPFARPWTASPRWGSVGTWTTSARATRPSPTCATCRSAA